METEYASKGVAGSGLGLGIAGTALGLLNGGLGGILGGRSSVAGAANDAMVLQMAQKDCEIAQLKADAATDKKLVDVYTVLRQQDKAQDANIAALKDEIHVLDKRIGETALIATNGITALNGNVQSLQAVVSSITKCVVPNSAVCPGWGQVTVTPSGGSVVGAVAA